VEPFIKSYQFNFIEMQTQNLVNGHASVNDEAVLKALRYSSQDKILNLFPDIDKQQRDLLNPFIEIKERLDAERFLLILRPYVIPFKEVTEKTVKKLFPKVKKLKVPDFDYIDLKKVSYLSWNDKGSGKRYIITEYKDKLIGLQGTFKNSNQKGICTFCNGISEVGMFMTEVKGDIKGTYIKRGNYICQDSESCNHNLIEKDKLDTFIEYILK